jgi:hypothetical protein
MGRGGDYVVCYTADVSWTTTGTGKEVRGASSVRDYNVVALHDNIFNAQTRRIVADGHAFLEGD